MANFEEATRLAEKLFREEQAKQAEKEKRSTIPKVENQEKIIIYKKEDKMKKFRINKTFILVAVYIVLIITELFFYVPYNNIQVIRTQQNVPHTIITGSGYASMSDITKDNANIDMKINRWESSGSGKTVNTSQLWMNVSLTTILAIGLYLILQRKNKIIIKDDSPIPTLDINGLAFADEDTQKNEMEKYARRMAEYVKRNL